MEPHLYSFSTWNKSIIETQTLFVVGFQICRAMIPPDFLRSAGATETMNRPASIGQAPWTREQMLAQLQTFASLYEARPIEHNDGGMLAPHMFMAWFAARCLRPKVIIESGVWLGQGTWLFEQACPEAELYCIEPAADRIAYRSKRASYFTRDFSKIAWKDLPLSETLVFFDDHQNAFERLTTCKKLGFVHILFEDNYPPARGDCYSLKMALMNSGFSPPRPTSFAGQLKLALMSLLGATPPNSRKVPPNDADSAYLHQNVDVYYEFPPVFKTKSTRWHDCWDDERYPTPDPLLESVTEEYQRVFFEDARTYNWMCYVRLKEDPRNTPPT